MGEFGGERGYAASAANSLAQLAFFNGPLGSWVPRIWWEPNRQSSFQEITMTLFCAGVEIALYVLWTVCGAQSAESTQTSPRLRLDPNLKCVDLSDLNADLPLEVTRSIQILRQTEPWELSSWRGDTGRESVGYPTMVQNNHGPNPDGHYYLYYAHHDPNSGIGCAVAESIEGPYVKLAEKDPTREDSRALVCPGQTRPTLPLLQPLRRLERGRTTLVHVLPLLREPMESRRRTSTHSPGHLPRTCQKRMDDLGRRERKAGAGVARDGRALDEQPVVVPRSATSARWQVVGVSARHGR